MPRPKGSKNKRTIEKEAMAARQVAAAAILGNPEDVARQVTEARAAGRKLGKDILSEFANVLAGMAAYYQPSPDGSNRNGNEKQFKYYTELALYAADKAAPFESPRLSAVAIGQTQVTTIKVEGGMPDEFSAPAGGAPKLPPLTVINAEDDDLNAGSASAA